MHYLLLVIAGVLMIPAIVFQSCSLQLLGKRIQRVLSNGGKGEPREKKQEKLYFWTGLGFSFLSLAIYAIHLYKLYVFVKWLQLNNPSQFPLWFVVKIVFISISLFIGSVSYYLILPILFYGAGGIMAKEMELQYMDGVMDEGLGGLDSETRKWVVEKLNRSLRWIRLTRVLYSCALVVCCLSVIISSILYLARGSY